MNLPFSEAQFLDVFADYNRQMWAVVFGLWAITLAVALWWGASRNVRGRVVWTLLALHWLISGGAYHWWFFRRINPVAAAFAVLFVAQAAVFAWLGVSSRGRVAIDRSMRSIVAIAFVAYGLAYPFVGLAFGLRYPRLPLFAVPCPTTLVTAGWLIAATGVPRSVSVIPILWAAVGASAAWALGIRADLALIVAALALIVRLKADTTGGVAPGAVTRR